MDDYAPFVGLEEVHEIRTLASYLRGARVQHINSTAVGGGVAELLGTLVPLMRDVGLDARWDVMKGSQAFFEVTKAIHNSLHGAREVLTPEGLKLFWDTTQENLGVLERDADFECIHDPQPLGLVKERGEKARWLWRCHIDLSDADPGTWSFLRQIVERYDGAAFHLPEYAKELSIPQYVAPPAIDPLNEKNTELTQSEITSVLERYQLDPRLPIVMQVSRYDRLKDPVGVIRSYQRAARSHPCQLVLVGGAANDDPEGAQVLAEVQEAAQGDPNIHVLVMAPGTGRDVNALQRAATIVVQKSVREGFGLVVTEAMWKGKPVIGGAVGGIRSQILQGTTGFLVHSVEGTAYRIRQLLGNPDLARQLGANARRYVIENFLPTTYLKRWLLMLLSLRHRPARAVVALGTP
ncbi:MAG: glycosyltransferase [Deltaproteobacteria bacterium]|nr:glycosyltransferase [Deltaproteobacteria bacterium]